MTVQPAERVVDTDLSVIEALDFEPEIVCENRTDCPNSAQWKVYHRCCGNFAGICCDPCRAVITGYISVFYFTKACNKCNAPCAPDALRFEPIKPPK